MGIKPWRAVPGSPNNNGGKGEYAQFAKKRQYPTLKIKTSESSEHFSTIRKFHATFRLVGIGIGGSIAATAAWQNNHPRLKKIITINTPYELEQPEQYLDATRGDSQIPLTMYVTDPALAPPSERPYLIVKPFLEWLPMITEAVSQLSN
ncbi:hypothetical protein [Victivallis sp. Marseille-Q1083]|uniref:hypothetical protein n=1 Tax=Victivallis sp. Marseille-Q1083 TaxID=2717288 RepID=UPI00158B2FE6|nr:hypothetical protein [Victivallis sp. Marseille-Q1083]